MIDYSKTIHYIKGAITDPRNTWQEFVNENPGWKTTAKLITAPLIISTAVLTYILSMIFRSYQPYGAMTGSFRFFVLSLVFTFLGYFIFSAVIAYLAGYFKGKNNFDMALGAVTLAAVPAAIGSVVGTLPFIGPIFSIVLSIYSLVLLYRNIPVFLNVPQENRVKHFISTLVVSLIIGFVLSFIMQLFYWTDNYQIENPNLDNLG